MGQVVVYVSCASSLEIASFRLDTAIGALVPLARTRVPGPVEPATMTLPIALSADGGVFYAGVRTPPYPVSAFAVGTGGTLGLLGSGRLAAPPMHLAADPAGRALFAASYHGDRLMANRLDAEGVPGEPGCEIGGLTRAHCVLPEPEGRAFYAAILGQDRILRQEIDPESGLMDTTPHEAARCAEGAGARMVVFGAEGRWIYCVNELDATVDAYARDPASGALERRQTVPLGTPPAGADGKVPGWSADLHLTPDGRFLYASERRSNRLVGFHVASDGMLSPAGIMVEGEANPWAFAIDPYGRWLICPGHDSGQVAVYAIDGRSGALTRVGAAEGGGNMAGVLAVKLTE